MDELEKLEASLCDECLTCCGDRLSKVRGKGRIWCTTCGGSGLRRTVNPWGGNVWREYKPTSIHDPAPYKDSEPNE